MKKNLIVSGTSALFIFIIMRFQGYPLITPISKKAIVDLEFADTSERLHELLSHWDLAIVKLNIWLDFLFIVAYVSFLAYASLAVTSKSGNEGKLQRTGIWMARVAFLAGVFDILENLLMLQSINGSYSDPSLILTYYCAAIKFFLIGVVISFLLIRILTGFIKKG